MSFRRYTLVLVVISLAILFTCAKMFLSWRAARSADVRLWFFDVGQGDAALLRDRDGKDLLIDGGPDASLLEGLSEAMPLWDRKIDVVLVTHLDADHYVGLFSVLRKYEVGEIWWSGAAPTTETARRFVARVQAEGIPQRFVRAGDVLAFAGGNDFRVLWPREDLRGRLVATNAFAVVGSFACGTEHALFTADIPAETEARLVDQSDALRAELLKIPHHGSAHSSSAAFLDAVRPKAAVISSGLGNRYGHPAPRVLSALLDRGVRVRRTDREGTILYACIGGKLLPM